MSKKQNTGDNLTILPFLINPTIYVSGSIIRELILSRNNVDWIILIKSLVYKFLVTTPPYLSVVFFP